MCDRDLGGFLFLFYFCCLIKGEVLFCFVVCLFDLLLQHNENSGFLAMDCEPLPRLSLPNTSFPCWEDKFHSNNCIIVCTIGNRRF